MSTFKEQVKKYWMPILWAFITIVASAGSINHGVATSEHVYTVFGILNVLSNGYLIYKDWRKNND